jgi:hypothetical protein
MAHDPKPLTLGLTAFLRVQQDEDLGLLRQL